MRNHFILFALLMLISTSALALSSTSVSSETHPEQNTWYNGFKIDLAWTAVEGAAGYSYLFDQEPSTTPDAEIETTETLLSTPSKTDGTWYFHIAPVSGDQTGPVTHFKINIDRTKPYPPQNVQASANQDGIIFVTWDEPFDEYAGISHYAIHRKNERDFEVKPNSIYKIEDNYKETQYLDDDPDLYQGVAYFYKLVAFDRAGNQSGISPQVYALTPRRCDAKVQFDTPDYVHTPVLTLSASSTEGNMYQAYLKIKPIEDVNLILVADRQDDVSEISGDFNISEYAEGDFFAVLNARDSLFGDLCDINKIIGYDKTLPEANLLTPESNETLTGIYQLKATASDKGSYQSGIAGITFYYEDNENWIEIGTATEKIGDTYVYDWNTEEHNNGRFEFKAIARDKAGNKVELPAGKITLKNTAKAMAELELLMDTVSAAKNDAKTLKKELEKNSVYSEKFYSLYAQAMDNLETSERLEKKEDYSHAIDFANTAKGLFESAATSVALEAAGSEQYIYNKEQLSAAYAEAGLNNSLHHESTTLTKNNEVVRNLRVTKVTDSNNIYYTVNVDIVFINKDTNSTDIQIIEAIPKALLQSANDFKSDTNHAILNQDPVISFPLGKIGAGRRLTITYLLDANLTKQEADQYISEHRVNKFPSPPIILYNSTEVGAYTVSPPLILPSLPEFDFMGSTASATAGSLEGNDLFLILVGVAVIIILLLIITILAIILLRMIKKGKGFGVTRGKQTNLSRFK